MDRFTVFSPFDGEPIPAQNEQVRDSLFAEGYFEEEPTEKQLLERAADRAVKQLAAEAAGPEHLLATGGPVVGPVVHLEGERGPELVELPEGQAVKRSRRQSRP